MWTTMYNMQKNGKQMKTKLKENMLNEMDVCVWMKLQWMSQILCLYSHLTHHKSGGLKDNISIYYMVFRI